MMKEYIEEYLEPLLQCEVFFMLGPKKIKQGKLLVYTIKDYIISFTIRNNKNQLKSYDVYYPYDVYLDKNKRLVFDYTTDTLTTSNNELMELIELETKDTKNHKLFDSLLTIVDSNTV